MDKTIVTTSWDDGSENDLRLAELLNKYGLKGTFYIPKLYPKMNLKKKDILYLAQVFEIGSHSLSHSLLTKLSPLDAEKEIRESKVFLENLIGKSVIMFSYPYGRYNTFIKKVVKNCGYIGARTTIPGSIDLPKDVFELQVTQYTSINSPFIDFLTCVKHKIPLKYFFDWEIKGKILFEIALKKGGIYHLWGHSWEINERNEWDKLERLFKHISKHDDTLYVNNSFILKNYEEMQSENSFCL